MVFCEFVFEFFVKLIGISIFISDYYSVQCSAMYILLSAVVVNVWFLT